MTRSLGLALVAVLALGDAAPARAQPATEDQTAFKDHYERGIAHYQAGDYGGSARELEQAYRIDPQPDVAFALAQSLRLSGDCTGALVYYRVIDLAAASAPRRKAIEEAMQPCVVAEEADRKRREQAAVPPAPVELAPAPERSVAAAPPPLDRPAERDRWYADPLGTSLVALGVVGLGAGGAGFALSGAAYDDAEAAPSESEFADRVATGDRWRTAGVVSLIAGGVLTSVGIARWIRVARRADRGGLAMTPDPRGGVWLAGTF